MDTIHLPPGLTLPSAFGAPATPFQPGQVIQALVLDRVENDIFRLQLPQGTVDVRSSVPLTPGNTITLAVKSTGATARFAIYTDVPAGPSGASLAGRTSIGEAVVIARGAGQGTLAVKQAAAPVVEQPRSEPVVVREVTAPEAPRIAMTPEQAVRDAMHAGAPRQTGLAPLFAELEQIARAKEQSAVPPAIRQAAANLLSLRVPRDEQLTAADVKQAFGRSGLLFEAQLAEGSMPAPSADMKAALLVLRQVLNSWSAGDRPQRAPTSAEEAASLAKFVAAALLKRDAPATTKPMTAVPPPYRGAPPAAQAVAAPSIMPEATDHEIASKLIAETDGALARQTLLQLASLPEQPDQPRAETTQRWNFEVPFATPQGTAIAQFEVSRDGGTAKSDPPARTWRVRFALDVEPMGPVHALIALSGPRTSVTLWAERPATATRLNENAAMLTDALRAAELEPADFQFRTGAPPALAKQAAPGRFMDRAT